MSHEILGATTTRHRARKDDRGANLRGLTAWFWGPARLAELKRGRKWNEHFAFSHFQETFLNEAALRIETLIFYLLPLPQFLNSAARFRVGDPEEYSLLNASGNQIHEGLHDEMGR
jgi:hypothetical protein